MVTISPRPHSTLSPALTGPTPGGVPVRIRSPGSKVKCSLIQLTKYGIVKIMSLVFPFWRTFPFTFNHRSTFCGSTIFSFGMNWLTGHAVSKPFAKLHGSPAFFAFPWAARSVMSRARTYPPMWSNTLASGIELPRFPMTRPSSTSWWSSVAPFGSWILLTTKTFVLDGNN